MTPKALREYLKAQGVELAVALGSNEPAVSGYTPNEYVAAFCRETGNLIPFLCLNPNREARADRELAEAVSKLGFKGLKLTPSYGLYPVNENRLYPLLGVAQELKLPVMVHTGVSRFPGSRVGYINLSWLDEVASDFPALVIIMAHGGRGFDYKKAAFLARARPNLYLETSGLPPRNLLADYPELEAISDKVIFGSDWPGVPADHLAIINAILALPLSSSALEKILYLNAARLLNIHT